MYFINAVVLTSTTLGGVIHFLLVVAVLLVAARIFSGRNHERIGQGN